MNDKVLDQPFDFAPSEDDHAAFVVPNGEYFVLGDNRPNSLDSRYFKRKSVRRIDLLGIVSNIIRKADYDSGKRW